MKAERDPKTGKWLIQYRYTDQQGMRRKSTKRGFSTKREAEDWVMKFLATSQMDLNMKFSDFLDLYYKDIESQLREYTIQTKKYIVDRKILPYFGEKAMNQITVSDVRKWQNILMQQEYSETYLRTINNQLAAIFNFAVKYYDLKSNPCSKAGSMGKSKAEKVDFWTKQEFMNFIQFIDRDSEAYVLFMLLYWTGMRVGEALALKQEDIDFQKRTIWITKSYQRIKQKDVITPPGTPKGKRKIKIPDFLAEILKQFICNEETDKDRTRLFQIKKYRLLKEMQEGIAKSGVKTIRIYDLRHSHASLLVELGFSPLEIAEQLGHERIETTLNTYSHLYPDKQDRLADRLEEEYHRG